MIFYLLQIYPAPEGSFSFDAYSLWAFGSAMIVFAGVYWGLRKCIKLLNRS